MRDIGMWVLLSYLILNNAYLHVCVHRMNRYLMFVQLKNKEKSVDGETESRTE